MRQTGIFAVNRQPTAMRKGLVNWFPHETLRLPNGHTLILAPSEPSVDIVGDLILDLDTDVRVA